MRTMVYVDGFNLYYGCLKRTPHRWLDLPPRLPAGSFYKPIRSGALAASQFQETLADSGGTFSKPPDW